MVSRRYTLLAALFSATLMLGLLHAAPGQATLVIVTQKNSSLSELSLREVKRLYRAEQVTGPDGRALIPLNHALGSPTRIAFESLVLKMSQDEVGRFWIDRKIRGQVGSPKSVAVIAVLRKAVATLPGTLTYLDANDLTPDLKVLAQYTTESEPYTSDVKALAFAVDMRPSPSPVVELGDPEFWGRQVAWSR